MTSQLVNEPQLMEVKLNPAHIEAVEAEAVEVKKMLNTYHSLGASMRDSFWMRSRLIETVSRTNILLAARIPSGALILDGYSYCSKQAS